jgi:hypothetical protein
MKKVMFGDWGGGCCAWLAVDASDTAATDTTIARHSIFDIFALPFELVIAPWQEARQRNLIRANGHAAPNALRRRHPRLTGSGFTLTLVRK